MSGGSGLIISREALRRLVKHAFTLKKNCMPDGQGKTKINDKQNIKTQEVNAFHNIRVGPI